VHAIPGQGSNVPVWLLGSSTYSASLAATLGLPFAFASHFAPQELLEAFRIYRESFQPSSALASPYAMAGVPLVAAPTDAEAQYLATSVYQRGLRLIRGEPIFTPPPTDRMDDLWSPAERAAVESRLGVAIIGGPETVQRKVEALLQATGADELIFTSDLYDHAHRLRSFEILAGAMQPATPAASR
jgi:luciferase family oxidoreductase group 1